MRRQRFFPLGAFTRDSIIKKSLYWTILFWTIGTLSLVFAYSKLPPVTPLFYSLIRGEQQLASKQLLLTLPTISLVSIILHYWLARANSSSDRTLSRLLAASSTFITFLFMIALVHIIIIVL